MQTRHLHGTPVGVRRQAEGDCHEVQGLRIFVNSQLSRFVRLSGRRARSEKRNRKVTL